MHTTSIYHTACVTSREIIVAGLGAFQASGDPSCRRSALRGTNNAAATCGYGSRHLEHRRLHNSQAEPWEWLGSARHCFTKAFQVTGPKWRARSSCVKGLLAKRLFYRGMNCVVRGQESRAKCGEREVPAHVTPKVWGLSVTGVLLICRLQLRRHFAGVASHAGATCVNVAVSIVEVAYVDDAECLDET